MYIETLKNVNLHALTENRCNSCKKYALVLSTVVPSFLLILQHERKGFTSVYRFYPLAIKNGARKLKE